MNSEAMNIVDFLEYSKGKYFKRLTEKARTARDRAEIRFTNYPVRLDAYIGVFEDELRINKNRMEHLREYGMLSVEPQIKEAIGILEKIVQHYRRN